MNEDEQLVVAAALALVSLKEWERSNILEASKEGTLEVMGEHYSSEDYDADTMKEIDDLDSMITFEIDEDAIEEMDGSDVLEVYHEWNGEVLNVLDSFEFFDKDMVAEMYAMNDRYPEMQKIINDLSDKWVDDNVEMTDGN